MLSNMYCCGEYISHKHKHLQASVLYVALTWKVCPTSAYLLDNVVPEDFRGQNLKEGT